MIIEQTADGSPTIYLPEMDEHYHSVKGALTESRHVYVGEAFLRKVAEAQRPIRVLEVGFGTGLNTALTAMTAMGLRGVEVSYFALELYPLEPDVIASYASRLNLELMDAAARAPWDIPRRITPNFILTKLHADFLTSPLPADIDVVYFDAFAPDKQPEMWSDECFRRLYDVMRPGAILTTYCAKGAIRRRLASIGFMPERIAGPPGGKREIIRATRP